MQVATRHPHDLLKMCRPCLLLAAAVVAIGCAPVKVWWQQGLKLGPDYRRPCAAVADDWIDFNNPRVISAGHDANDAVWWNTFADPVLDELIGRAYRNNRPLRVAGLRVLEAQAQRAAAVGNLFPQQQEAFGQYQRTQFSRNGNPFGVPNFPVRAFNLWQVGFNASWEIDVWGRVRRSIESADATLEASVEDYDDVLVCLIAETAATYVEYRTFQRRLAIAHQNVTTQEDNLELAESRFRNGATSRLDVTQATASLERTRALIPDLKKGVRQANNRLCLLLGIPSQDLAGELGEAPIPSTSPEIVVGVPADLLRRRPDVRKAERNVAAQSPLIGVAMADLFPRFSIAGTFNWAANDFSDLFRHTSQAGNIVPGINWNLLNYGRLVNNVRVQDARFQQLAVNYQETVLRANTEVENAIVGFLTAQERAAALERAVEAASQSLRVVQRQYRGGTTDFDRVNNLQRDLLTQQDTLAQATAEIAASLIAVYKSLGGGWQIRTSRTSTVTPPEVLETTVARNQLRETAE